MLNRRAFLAGVASHAWRGAQARAQEHTWLYASVGSELLHYEVDVEGARLHRRSSIQLPADVQYAWPHVSNHVLYVASSNGGPGRRGDRHQVSAFQLDPATGILEPQGAAVPLRSRPIHLTTDRRSDYLFIAYNDPSQLTSHRLFEDGRIGSEIPQPAPIDAGVYAHQVRVMPSNAHAIVVARGNDASAGRPEDPGALKVFTLRYGVLTPQQSVAPGGGYGFGPRHLDFHPATPWVYVSLERQNQVCVFRWDGTSLSPEPVSRHGTLASAGRVGGRQLAGTIHVHPNGRYVYVANRADATLEADGTSRIAAGENTIAAYVVHAATGRLTAIQHVDTRGLHPRTFHIEPTGRLLVAANLRPLRVRDGAALRTIPASLVVFRIGTDGRLTYVRTYEIDVGSRALFWMGMVP
ncbi:MAG: lactonase family protein [Vicinamibacterales bacterium]